jgi:UDP-N-acetylglucosamine 2-epimerase
MKAVRLVQEKSVFPVAYSAFPRTWKQLDEFQIECTVLRVIEPLDYLGFPLLEHKASPVLTDYGGAQKENCILVPSMSSKNDTVRSRKLRCGFYTCTDPKKGGLRAKQE